MIIVYNKVTNKQILKDAKKAVKQIQEWFGQNPNRRICKAELWYGKVAKIRKNHIEADINKAAEVAIAGNK